MLNLIKKKIGNVIKGKLEKAVPNFDPTFFSTRRQLLMPSGSFSFDQPYTQNVWISASCKKIATSVSQSPYVFYIENERTNQKKELPNNHELNRLFDNPNPLMSRQELIYNSMIFMGLDGEAFWIIDRGDDAGKDVTSFPQNIWCFRKNYFRPEIDKNTGLIKFWNFEGGPKIIRVENVIQFKYFNPDNHYQGLAPWMSAQLSSEQDYYASNHNTNFFKSGASIGGFIESEDPIDDDEYDRLMSSIEDRHVGHTKSHRLMLLEGGMKFKEATISQKDMEFIETKKIAKSEILAAYGTNPVVLGDFNDVKSEAGVRAILKDFWTSVVIPNQDYLENKLYHSFLVNYNPNIRVYFDNSNIEVLQEDLDIILDRAKKFLELGYTTNQINQRLSLQMPEIEQGNISYVTNSVKTVDQAIAEAALIGGNVVVESNNDDQESTEEEMENTDENENTEEEMEKSFKDAKDILFNYSKNLKNREKAVNDFGKEQKKYERKFERDVKLYFKQQEKRVINYVNSLTFIFTGYDLKNINIDFKAIEDDALDDRFEIEELLQILYPLWRNAYQDMFEETAARLELSIEFDDTSSEFLRFMEFKVRNITPSIFETVKESVRNALKDGLDNKETIQEIAARIKKVYEVSNNRALVIARTESTSSLNAGTLEIYQNPNSKVNKIRWITAMDENVRSSHAVLNGQLATPGEFFVDKTGRTTKLRFPGDMNAPAHDVINCRCNIVEDFSDLE